MTILSYSWALARLRGEIMQGVYTREQKFWCHLRILPTTLCFRERKQLKAPFPLETVHGVCKGAVNNSANSIPSTPQGIRWQTFIFFLLCRMLSLPGQNCFQWRKWITRWNHLNLKWHPVNMMLLDRNVFKLSASNFNPIKLFLW